MGRKSGTRLVGRNEYRELVQIAAIKVDTEKLEEVDAFTLFVLPKKNPILSEYFTNLTGITQDKLVAEGVSYPDALSRYVTWSDGLDTYSFGGDERILKENCVFENISFIGQNKFFDARDVFMAYGIPADKYMSGTIVEAFGEKLSRDAHNALNDVRTILDGFVLLRERFI